MGMVFQNYALYSHKTVYENIAYPLRIRKMPAPRSTAACARWPSCCKSAAISTGARRSCRAARRSASRSPARWSGSPSLCLMDEPLSNLDALLRLQTRTELKRLHRELKKTFVFVTHDQEEAMTLATRIAVLREGALSSSTTRARSTAGPPTASSPSSSAGRR